MHVEIARHALDRVPLSVIFDDSTMLVNLNYFFMRDRNLVDGQNRRWQDVPVVHPESFVREFAEWSLEQGVKGKFSVVPCPAGLGRLDEGLPLFSKAQQESWLKMCREMITPSYDITPEMITHTHVVDLDTFKPLESGIWEQYDWNHLPTDREELITDYIATACQILHNVGLTPEGVTSPGQHNEDRRGFDAFKTVVSRLVERDPNGERTRWRKCSEIANHAMAREMAELSVTDSTITLDLPVRVPEFTLRVTGAPVRGVAVDGQPLTSAPTRAAFEDNSFYRDGDVTFAAFAPGSRHSTVEILH